MQTDRKLFCKKDLYIIGCALLLAAAAFIIYALTHSGQGDRVRITVDGREYAVYELGINGEYTVPGCSGGSCTVVIADGAVSFREATCPDKLCVRHARVSHSGECIICLPNRVVAEVFSSYGEQELDGVSR